MGDGKLSPEGDDLSWAKGLDAVEVVFEEGATAEVELALGLWVSVWVVKCWMGVHTAWEGVGDVF